MRKQFMSKIRNLTSTPVQSIIGKNRIINEKMEVTNE